MSWQVGKDPFDPKRSQTSTCVYSSSSYTHESVKFCCIIQKHLFPFNVYVYEYLGFCIGFEKRSRTSTQTTNDSRGSL